MELRKYYDMKGLCELIGLSRYTVSALIKKREIPFKKLSQRTYRFDFDEIKAWMDDRSVDTVDEAMKKAT